LTYHLDGLEVTILSGIGAFVVSSVFSFYTIHKRKPDLLKPAKIQETPTDEATTFNWNVILALFVACATFAAGIWAFSGIVVFMVYGRWYLDTTALIIMTIVFLIFVFREFDRFLTRHTR
jgi:hypothetical protein